MLIRAQIALALCLVALLIEGHAPPGRSAVSVQQFLAAPPTGKIAAVHGYVVGSYVCPPCPLHLLCKPCMSPSSIVIADAIPREGSSPPAILRLETEHPSDFRKGVPYIFTIELFEPGNFDAGRLLKAVPQ